MYTLTYGLVSHMLKKEDFFVVIVGLDNAGKTTFLEQTKMKFTHGYSMMNPAKITSTVGMNIGKVEYRNIRLNFWDLGGQEGLHSLWDKYFPDSNALIFVVDSSDEERFSEARVAFGAHIKYKFWVLAYLSASIESDDERVRAGDACTGGVQQKRLRNGY
uniref:ADP-ribosylation factor-related protein 1 n=1 Tax=Steinernema glaseri TaxID=37863 RepID=A0A1I7YYD1_9BILA